MTHVPIYQVDAFADKPFTGNPAAVCLLDQEPERAWMQSVGAEMNLSETAFVWPTESGPANELQIRWFTPAAEVALCGHATLASAHVLWTGGLIPAGSPIRFQTRESGTLHCRLLDGGIEMDFPVTVLTQAPPQPGLVEALGLEPVNSAGAGVDLLVEVSDEATLHGITPRFDLIRSLSARGVIVTARGGRYDFVSRFFAPTVGVDEDPVTGSAHCALAPYWAAQLDKTSMVGYQASKRGGEVGVRLDGARVILTGRAITVLVGQLLV